jgi:hypothetical protein
MSTEYNGWSNYATWNVNLWLANDEPMYRDVSRMAERERDDSGNTPQDEVAAALGERIREYVTDLWDTFGSFGDLRPEDDDDLGAVDWDEVASAWLEE